MKDPGDFVVLATAVERPDGAVYEEEGVDVRVPPLTPCMTSTVRTKPQIGQIHTEQAVQSHGCESSMTHPRPYQQSAIWTATHINNPSGEQIHYLHRPEAKDIEPDALGADDWWLLDTNRLIVMHFDRDGKHRTSTSTPTETQSKWPKTGRSRHYPKASYQPVN